MAIKLGAQASNTHAPAAVFRAYRDRIYGLKIYLANIKGVAEVSRDELGDETLIVNRWTGGGNFPAVFRQFLVPALLTWEDRATWHEPSLTVQWKITPLGVPGAVTCDGTTRFEPSREGTRVSIKGKLDIDASKVPNVPDALRPVMSQALEAFVILTVRQNLKSFAEAVDRALAKKVSFL